MVAKHFCWMCWGYYSHEDIGDWLRFASSYCTESMLLKNHDGETGPFQQGIASFVGELDHLSVP